MEWWALFCWIVTTQYELSRSRGHWFISFWTIESLLASFPSRSSIRVGCLTDFRLTHSSTYFESIHFFQPYIHTATLFNKDGGQYKTTSWWCPCSTPKIHTNATGPPASKTFQHSQHCSVYWLDSFFFFLGIVLTLFLSMKYFLIVLKSEILLSCFLKNNN